MVGSIWVAVASPPPQEVLKASFLCQCFLHCTQIILFTWAFLLSGPEEKRRAVQHPIEVIFLRGPCVDACSVYSSREGQGEDVLTQLGA